MMMTALNPGEKIAIPRNSHKSAMGGLIMSGGYPVWMKPEVDEDLHMDHTVTPQTVRETLEAHPDIKAVYVVSPTYYGVAADLEGIAAVAHEYDIPLLVDEAWGPHFHFHPALPISAMASGRRHVHQFDAQDARLALTNRDAARARHAHQARPAEGRL